ncbi:cell division protein ZapA [Mangrovicoccus algicola]|uniref:Cell division protein ZapA n=1 Tax=Mangrovicoccus algicola TaxID=2771008 RepID=A0A8J6YPL3_9RHOB|nr:cell division protein ZapA [Mangrovicoccus algicola]MBE3637098.1 cell division protein ZapA [Mangrovicoccus algicola]
MPEVTISIGGRDFDVACQEGEQPFLETAARMLDAEAQTLAQQIGRMPELRMLLMAGLMLADKTAGLEDQLADLSAQLASQQALVEELGARAAEPGPMTEEMAARLEALAARAEAAAEMAGE